MGRGLILSYPHCSIVILLHPYSCPLTNPNLHLHLSQKPNFSSHIRFSHRRWDSNAETFRTQRSKFNFRDAADADEEEEEEEGEEFQEMDPGSALLEDVIDSFWIFKVFGSFGWMLPLIIFSILLTTGPKAFLMALALPLGQSALSLAFKRLWGITQNSPKRRVRTKKKPFARTPGNVVMDDEKQGKSQGSRKRKMGYQSWVAGNSVSVDKDAQAAPKFGGWDELDGGEEFGAGSMWRRSAQTAGSSRRTPVMGKLSRGVRKGDTPLLLRLLIAVFPFLGSWTKML